MSKRKLTKAEIAELVNGITADKIIIKQKTDSVTKGTNLLKNIGPGRYEGDTTDCAVVEVETTRINVEKLCKKLGIAEHIFNKYYVTTSTTLRASIVPKQVQQIEHKQAA